jgi:hypothetical protein
MGIAVLLLGLMRLIRIRARCEIADMQSNHVWK